MSKNKTFNRKYTLTVNGVTTNNFMVRFLDSTIVNIAKALSGQFKSLKVLGITAESFEQRKKLKEVFKCEVCGALMWNDGQTKCLLHEDEDGPQ